MLLAVGTPSKANQAAPFFQELSGKQDLVWLWSRLCSRVHNSKGPCCLPQVPAGSRMHVADWKDTAIITSCIGISAGVAVKMTCHHHIHSFDSLSSSSTCLFRMHNHPSLCAAGTWVSSVPLDQSLWLCWALPSPTSGILSAPLQTRTRCVRQCVCLCLLCVHELSEAHGHATCSFSMLFAVHTTVCSIATAASLFSAPCVSVLHSLLGLACEHMHPRALSASHCVPRVFCHAVKQHTMLCSTACKILQTNV